MYMNSGKNCYNVVGRISGDLHHIRVHACGIRGVVQYYLHAPVRCAASTQ